MGLLMPVLPDTLQTAMSALLCSFSETYMQSFACAWLQLSMPLDISDDEEEEEEKLMSGANTAAAMQSARQHSAACNSYSSPLAEASWSDGDDSPAGGQTPRGWGLGEERGEERGTEAGAGCTKQEAGKRQGGGGCRAEGKGHMRENRL